MSLRSTARLDLAEREMGEPGDGRQDVVEVVRDAAGQGAHRVDLLRALQLLLEHAMVGDVEREADHADDLTLAAERLEPDLGHPATQLALAVDGFPGERDQVVGDRLELGIVGLEVLEEVEADDRVELRMEAQGVETWTVRGRDPQVTVDDPERRGDPGQDDLAGLVDGQEARAGSIGQTWRARSTPLSRCSCYWCYEVPVLNACQSSTDTGRPDLPARRATISHAASPAKRAIVSRDGRAPESHPEGGQRRGARGRGRGVGGRRPAAARRQLAGAGRRPLRRARAARR